MEIEIIQNKIYEIRNQRVMPDFDLAELYGTETKHLKKLYVVILSDLKGMIMYFNFQGMKFQNFQGRKLRP
jgi:ribosomal protein S3AE